MSRAEEIFEKLKREGEAAIDELIMIRQSEELFLDFKRSANNGRGPKVLHETDRNNLAKAISGFGNSEGGVIIWGVDASPDADYADVANAKKPIENISRFVSWLEGTVSGRTVPPHIGIQNYPIDIGSGKGFVATLITKSERAPHQAIPEQKYYMRAGSNFVPVPHAVLAGMFGRRPQPELFERYVPKPIKVTRRPDGTEIIDMTLGFKICNRGPVMARDLYSDIKVMLPGAGTIHFANMDDDWTSRKQSTEWLSMVSKDDFKLAPESSRKIFDLRVFLRPPFVDGKLWFRWSFGCDGGPMKLIENENGIADVKRTYREFLQGPRTRADEKRFVCDLFKLPGLEESSQPTNAEVRSPQPIGRKIRFRMQRR